MWQNQRNIYSLIGQNDISTCDLLIVFFCSVILFSANYSLAAEPSQNAHNAQKIGAFCLDFGYHRLAPFFQPLFLATF